MTLKVTRQFCMQEDRELIFKVLGEKKNIEFHFVFYKYGYKGNFLF